MSQNSESSQQRPIIIIKKIKKSAHEAHGGAWKVAYADFVTAMMAFFLLLWLLNSSSEEMRTGLADHFAPFSLSPSMSGSGDILKGRSLDVSHSQIKRQTVEKKPFVLSEKEQALMKAISSKEREAFEDAITQLLSSIKDLELKNHLNMKITENGLLLQIIDKEKRPLFSPGKSFLLRNAEVILADVSPIIQKIGKRLKITGHTDHIPFLGANDGTNWTLSMSRADSVRKFIQENGVSTEIIFEISGKADREPLIRNNLEHPSNRRIEILLMKNS